MIIGALGCNLAWGIIDGVFYVIGCLSERGRSNTALRALRKAADAEEAQGIIAEAIPPALTSILPPLELQAMRQKLSQLPELPPYLRFTKSDLRGAFRDLLACFPVHVSSRDSLHFHPRSPGGLAHFKWSYHRDAVSDRPCVRLLSWAAASVVDGPLGGRFWSNVRRNRNSPRRMNTNQPIGALAVLVFLGNQVLAQEPSTSPSTESAGANTKQWSFSFTADGYVVPHGRSYVNPSLAVDHQRLHLEMRYDYEDLETGSLWVGYKFSAGHTLVLEATPMIGGVFGNATGVAPGYEFSLSYKKLELYSQGEYVFDTRDRAGSFFYAWPQLTYSPLDWLNFGLVAQRIKAYHTALDVQRGLFVGFSHEQVHFTTYLFNLGWTEPSVVFEFGVKF